MISRRRLSLINSPTSPPSLVRGEVHHVEPDVAVVPHVQVSVLRAVGQHRQDAAGGPQVEGHVHRLPLQQVESERDPGVLGVGDVQDPAGDEGVAGLGAWVGGVDVGRDREGLLVQLGHRDALVHAGGEDQPQAVLVRRQLEVGLGVVQQVGQAVVQRVVYGERVKPLGEEVESADKRGCYSEGPEAIAERTRRRLLAGSWAHRAMLEVPAMW